MEEVSSMTNPLASNWREIGDTAFEVFEQELARVNSPMLPYARALYERSKPHSAMFLAHSWIENQHATTGRIIKPEHHNPLSLAARYGEETIPYPASASFDNFFARYPEWVDAVDAWKRRFTDTRFGYKDSQTLDEYLGVYAPDGHVHPETGVDNADIKYPEKFRTLLRNYAVKEGQTPMPTIIDKWLHVAQDGYPAVHRRYIGRYGAKPKIIVLHIQQGTNSGSWQHFHSVSASATVLIGRNGDIWRLVPEEDSPWTNGDVYNPTAKAQAIRNAYGSDPNVYTLSIETEGYSYAPNAMGWESWPHPQKQIDSVVWQIKQWMTKYNIPIDMVVPHKIFNTRDKQLCPGDPYYDHIMKALDSGGTTDPVEYATPSPVLTSDGPWQGTNNVSIGQTVFYGEPRMVTCGVDGLQVRQYADPKSALTRGNLQNGDTFDVFGWVRATSIDGESRWWITKTYSRVWVGGTREKPDDNDTPPPSPTTNPVVLGGKEYYKSDKTIKVNRKANLRQWATTESTIVGAVDVGDAFKVAYWCVGEEVNGETLWWVLVPKDGGDPLQKGPRLWVAATNARPN
jgi:N-acetyl-anhydromuramyl-L-alanine amidase AmpD